MQTSVTSGVPDPFRIEKLFGKWTEFEAVVFAHTAPSFPLTASGYAKPWQKVRSKNSPSAARTVLEPCRREDGLQRNCQHQYGSPLSRRAVTSIRMKRSCASPAPTHNSFQASNTAGDSSSRSAIKRQEVCRTVAVAPSVRNSASSPCPLARRMKAVAKPAAPAPTPPRSDATSSKVCIPTSRAAAPARWPPSSGPSTAIASGTIDVRYSIA